MRVGKTMALGAAALLASAIPAAAQTAGPLAPRDSCVGQPGYGSFKASLEEAVAARDADALIALTEPEVKLDFGGGQGTDELRSRLASADYRLWDELDAVLRLGCGRGGEGEYAYIAFPWYFATDIGEDPYETWIVTGRGVRIRSAPNLSAPVVGSVSWDWVTVELDGDLERRGFLRVTTQGGQSGFMSVTFLRSLVDYRLIAERRDGRWQITALIAGD